MIKLVNLCLALLFISTSLFSQQQYLYSADLKNIHNDKVSIQLETPEIKETEVIFSFPKAIPGSYSQKDYGRFIDDLTALNKDEKELKVKKINANQYRISNAQTLNKITYKVNDTWDADGTNFIFQPGGSNIEAGKNVVLNNHAFFGYFEGYKMLPFQVTVLKPADFYASTHLEVNRNSNETDVLKAKDYVYLADNPVFYCKPDTTSFKVGNSLINVAVYSAKGQISSAQIADYLKPMSVALQKFFNGLPVKSYQFLYYFEDPAKGPSGKNKGGYGALEHNYSSLYFLPETALEPNLKSMVNEVSSHEFLHILTPLNLHSEEIENFDFTDPKMSQHLWLYEGVTEYFANLVQLQNGLLTEKAFFTNMRQKMSEAAKHGNFSMTEMSKNVLTAKFQSKYESVYNKGALTAFMLDLLIRNKTNDQKSLKTVIQDLAGRYGPSKPFKDEELFSELVKASDPAVNDFFNNYLIGDKVLPFNEFLQWIGYEFLDTTKKNVYFVGNMGLGFDEGNKTFLFKKVEKNALNIKEDDVFVQVNDNKITPENVNDLWEKYFRMNTADPNLKIIVKRSGVETELAGAIYTGYVEIKNYIGPVDNPSAEQLKHLNLFLGK
jgi:predicted metalloprotease with PDZ domain